MFFIIITFFEQVHALSKHSKLSGHFLTVHIVNYIQVQAASATIGEPNAPCECQSTCVEFKIIILLYSQCRLLFRKVIFVIIQTVNLLEINQSFSWNVYSIYTVEVYITNKVYIGHHCSQISDNEIEIQNCFNTPYIHVYINILHRIICFVL